MKEQKKREECFIKQLVKGVFKLVLVIVGILGLGIVLFFFWLSDSSPVNEAGREYKKNVKSYRNEEIKTMDDVYERLEVLDTHFNSTTFSKVQGGDKKEVTYLDIETLFGKPDKVVNDVDMYDAETVYQYDYEDITLNFHQRFRMIDAYVIEDYTATLYDPATLDRLFIDTIINHQTHYDKVNEQFDPIPKETIPPLMRNKTPTRNIRQSGWHTWSFNQQDYFDDGNGDYSPNEYLSLQYKEDDETELYLMERRYQATYLEKDSQEKHVKKKEAKYSYSDFFKQEESNNEDEKVRIADFSATFGDIARIIYDFREGRLWVSWLMNDGEDVEEITGTVLITDVSDISEINDLADLEILDIRFQGLSITDSILNTDAFVGSK